MLPYLSYVEVISGQHKGRKGRVVSSPWIGNLWHRSIQVNVPATQEEIRQVYGPGYGTAVETLVRDAAIGFGPRFWINVKASDVRRIEGSERADNSAKQSIGDFQ